MVAHLLMRLKLPHIPRLFTATIFPTLVSALLWTALGGLMLLNAYLRITKPLAYQNELFTVLSRPLARTSHITLATKLWSYGSRQTAKNELLLAASLAAEDGSQENNQVLGATTDPVDILKTWENEPARIASHIQFWKSVSLNHPDYPDAFMQLSALYYEQGNLIQAKTNIEKALEINPNGYDVTTLRSFLNKLLD